MPMTHLYAPHRIASSILNNHYCKQEHTTQLISILFVPHCQLPQINNVIHRPRSPSHKTQAQSQSQSENNPVATEITSSAEPIREPWLGTGRCRYRYRWEIRE